MREPDPKPPDRFPVFLLVACVALAALSILLTIQNVGLKAKIAAASAAANAPQPNSLKAGETLAPFDVVDAAGRPSHIEFGGEKKTLLLVFSSTCGACRQTLPVWNRLLAEGPPAGVKVVGLQLDFQQAEESNPNSALAVPDLRFPVYGTAKPQGEPLSKFPLIPAAALLGEGGAVKAVWFGTPTESQVSELRLALAG
jgi:thiol-disulfide isomerase/thioredoxin